MKRAVRMSITLGSAIVMAMGFGLLFLEQPIAAQQMDEDKVLAAYNAKASYPPIRIQNPLDETLFPPEMPPPVFKWSDNQSGANAWLVNAEFGEPAGRVRTIAPSAQWTPKTDSWETIKSRSVAQPAQVTILGFKTDNPGQVLSRGVITFTTSKDPVGAPLFYREVNLPFVEAVKDPSNIRWRFGSIASSQPPPVVLEHLPVCGNCHSFSADGQVLGMDVDYANSKGSYVIAKTAPQMALSQKTSLPGTVIGARTAN